METVKQQFDKYLKKVGLDKNKISKIQLTETQRAFYAGYILCFQNMAKISDLPENIALKELDKLKVELDKFWDDTLTN